MYKIVKGHHELRLINGFVKFYSLARKSHYEVLNLRRNCSEKEIKEAFIQMSKVYHPDRNKDKNAQQHFVRILEAYNTLSKPSRRAQYDSSMEINTRPHRTTYSTNMYHDQYYTRRQDYYQRNTYRQTECNEPPTDYYGVRGLKKVPNYVIVIICFGVAFFGTVFQIVVFREMYLAHRRRAEQQSRSLAEELERVRAAKTQTDQMHIKILLEKIVQSANPTIATASLGQALASEKK